MDSAEVARQSNVPASTLRYYEKKGLIRSVGRAGLKRVFDDDIIQRVAFIALGRAAGLSLDEIKTMVRSNGIQLKRDLLNAKASELDNQISRSTAMRDGLRHAAN